MLQLCLSGSRGYRARKKRMRAGAKGGMGVFEENISSGSKGGMTSRKIQETKDPRAGGMTLDFNKLKTRSTSGKKWEDGDERDKEMEDLG